MPKNIQINNGNASAKDRRRTARARRGFTLVEMMIVVGITLLLATLTLSAARSIHESSRSAKCASHLRQMITAALAYADDNKGQFPWASRKMSGYSSYCWDFIVPQGGTPQPGAMWDGYGISSVLQCPSYINGNANWASDPFTGYNYNASFVGKVEGDPATRQTPIRLAQIKDPSRTAVFGDGHWEGGANKFMRSPKSTRANDFSGNGLREAGTQGFRHRGKTNVAFADGHVEALAKYYTLAGKEGAVSSNQVICGFISIGNELYDLD